jgi:uncharacterized RmlC-like cupin family protein
MASIARVVGLVEAVEGLGPQGQVLTPMITSEVAGTVGLSGGMVRMPGGRVSKAHAHARSEIIVAVLAGSAATVVWDGDRPRVLPHGPGEMCYVPAGVPHGAVNLDPTTEVVALEFRTDPAFNDDVVLLPGLDGQLSELADELRRQPAPHPGQAWPVGLPV